MRPWQIAYQPSRKLRLEAAIDEHDEPFYGKTPELRTYAYRSRAKQGTTRFFRITSAYVIYRQLRLTLAVTFVLPEDETVDVVRRLYQRLQALKLHLGVLFWIAATALAVPSPI